MAKKMTKNEKYELLLNIPAVAENEMLCEFIRHEQELLVRKNANDGERKPTARQTENDGVKTEILTTLSDGEKRTITELLAIVPNQPADMTHSRMTSLLAQLVKDNAVVRIKDKKTTYFKIAEGD